MEFIIGFVIGFAMWGCGWVTGCNQTRKTLTTEFVSKIEEGNENLRRVLRTFPVEVQDMFLDELDRQTKE